MRTSKYTFDGIRTRVEVLLRATVDAPLLEVVQVKLHGVLVARQWRATKTTNANLQNRPADHRNLLLRRSRTERRSRRRLRIVDRLYRCCMEVGLFMLVHRFSEGSNGSRGRGIATLRST